MPENRNTGSTRNGSNGTRNNNRTSNERTYNDRTSARSEAGRTTARSASAGRTTSTARSTQGTRTSTTARSGQASKTAGTRRTTTGNGQSTRSTATRDNRYAEQPVRNTTNTKGKRKNTKADAKKKKKIALFVVEICVLAILLCALWLVNTGSKVNYVSINDDDIVIDEQVQELTSTGAMRGYLNIALFGVDSRNGELNKNTRTDTIMIASINQDTKEIKLVSVYRDTYLNLSNDTYNKANSAYAKGGPSQAINMLNMNLDLNITDFVTIGFDGLIDVVDAIGGIEIDVKESEITHLNNYQISMVGKESGKNAAGEANYVANAGTDYTPVTKSGLQTLNGLQATAYCRIRYIGNDFERTQRQRNVLMKVAEKAKTMNVNKLSQIAEAIFDETATSLELEEIISLLSEAAQYEVGENDGFPFEDNLSTGNIGSKGSCVVPTDLTDNVIKLHEFLFDETDYTPSTTVQDCSEKIYSDTSQYIN